MKKHFLLGLAAMLLPWTAWAQGQFTVTGVDETYEYSGVKSLTPTVQAYDKDLVVGTDYTISYSLDGVDVSEVKNVGTYTMTIAGAEGTLYENLKATTIEFTVTKKELTALSLSTTGGTKVYGTEDKDIKLNSFVPKEGIEGLVESDGDDEYENALKCLYLYRIDQVKGKEVANNTYKVIVRGKDKDEETGSNYYYIEAPNINSVDMTILPKELTVTIDGGVAESFYDKKTKTVKAKIDEAEIVVGDVVTVSFTEFAGKNADNTTLLNADEYTITATLDGADAGNYTLANGGNVTYTIKRATLKIDAFDETSLKKVYSGEEKAGADLTHLYKITTDPETDVTAEELGLKMVMGEGGGSENLPNVGAYLVNPTVNGTPIWMGQENKGYLEPALLPNYSISYERNNLKYSITERPVYYYFESKGTQYTGTTIALTDDSYTMTPVEAVEGESGFVGEDYFTEGSEPKAKFAADEVRNVKAEGYALETVNADEIKASNEDGDVTKNYTFELKQEEGKNVFMVTPGEMILTVKPQTVAFGTVIDDDVKAKWAAYNNGNGNGTGTVITNTPDYGDDRSKIRELITLTLSEDAATGNSGEYTGGIIIGLKSEGLTEEQITLLANYGGVDKIKKNNGTLTIEGVSEELVLDGSEVADDVEEGQETIMQKLNRLNGAEVSNIKIKNLKNFIADTGFGETSIIKKEQWYTLVLPFDVTVEELSKMFGYAIVNIPNTANDNPNKILFKLTMQTVPANTLMAFKVATDTDWKGKELSFEKPKKIVAPTGVWAEDDAHNKFIGVYEKDIITSDQDWIILPWNGDFWPASNAQKLGEEGFEVYPLNGYIHFDQPETAGIARTIGFENPDGTTSIVSATTGRVLDNNAEGWYTIGGIKLNGEPTQKGIYINNGKKVVIR